MKLAALDLGSNSFLCLIGETNQMTGQIVVEQDLLKVVRLGEGLNESKKFRPEALKRAEEAFIEFSEKIRWAQCDNVLGFATAAARDAENKNDFLSLCQKYQIPIEIISGNQEAQLTYLGALCSVQGLPSLNLNTNHHQLVIDIGGRSTEFVLGQNGQIKFAQSLNLGCVGLTEQFIQSYPPSPVRIQEMQMTLRSQILGPLTEVKKLTQGAGLDVVAVAGTPTTLATMEIGTYDVMRVEGFVLGSERLQMLNQTLSQLSPSQIQSAHGLDAKRADVIYVGSEILYQISNTLAELFGAPISIKVSTKGIRYGAMIELTKRLKKEKLNKV